MYTVANRAEKYTQGAEQQEIKLRSVRAFYSSEKLKDKNRRKRIK